MPKFGRKSREHLETCHIDLQTLFNAVVEEKRKVVQAVLDGGDMDERKGIANALLQSMVDAGDLPADLLKKVKNMLDL